MFGDARTLEELFRSSRTIQMLRCPAEDPNWDGASPWGSFDIGYMRCLIYEPYVCNLKKSKFMRCAGRRYNLDNEPAFTQQTTPSQSTYSNYVNHW